jgi:hypothetical protein
MPSFQIRWLLHSGHFMGVVFEEAGAAGSLGPEPKIRFLIPGLPLFCGVALSFSSTTTITKSTPLAFEVPAAFRTNIAVEFGSASWAEVAVMWADADAHGLFHSA